MKPAKCCDYQMDDERWAFALVKSEEGDKVNLTVQNPDDGTWFDANSVPKDSKRIR